MGRISNHESYRDEFAAIERDPLLTHRGKYLAEQAVMRRRLDEYEERLRHPFRELIRYLIGARG